MLRLLALRHAKSERNRPGSTDFDRTLNARGRDGALKIGRTIAGLDAVPRRILCSPAVRTRETLAAVAEAMAQQPETRFLAPLYEADRTQIMASVHTEGGSAEPLMIVGHNPAIQEFALGLIGQGDSDDIDQMRSNYPTAALAVLEAEIEGWHALTWHSCKLAAFVRPRMLD